MRVRLRPAYSATELANLYRVPHNHLRWPDHRLRVDATVQVARFLLQGDTVADLSCGNGRAARSLGVDCYLGDIAPGWPICGPIEQTLDHIPAVDLFLCCETLEHLDDPDLVLRKIRAKTRALVLSTPDGETEGHNPEHYWGWGVEDVRAMLVAAGFTPEVQMTLAMPALRVAYQIWGCV